METRGLSMDDAIFCGCAGAFVLVNLIVYCHEAPVLCRTWYGKAKSLRWRDWYPTISRNDQIREAFPSYSCLWSRAGFVQHLGRE